MNNTIQSYQTRPNVVKDICENFFRKKDRVSQSLVKASISPHNSTEWSCHQNREKQLFSNSHPSDIRQQEIYIST